MIAQPELDFTRPADPTADRRAELVAILRGHRWMTRRQLEAHGFEERELRLITEHDETCKILSYPGSPGYILFDEATLPEIDRADAIKSQIRKLGRKWIRIQRARHQRFPRP